MSPRRKTLILVGLAVVCVVAGVAVVLPKTPRALESTAPGIAETELLAPVLPHPDTRRIIVEIDPPESSPEDAPGE